MDFLRWLIHLLRDPGALVAWGGYGGVSLIVFLETGAMVFFLPGDSLLVVAGVYAAKGDLNLALLLGLLVPAAILGALLSYFLGSRLGPRLFNKPKSRWFNPAHLTQAHGFYERHGGSAIVIARFMPIVRTFVPVIAGIGQMPFRRYLAYTVIGGLAWVVSMCLVGYFLGAEFPALVKHIELVIVAVVLLSVAPALWAVWRARRRARAAAEAK